MVFGGNSITNTSENMHANFAMDSLKVLIHNLPKKVNIIGDVALDDHWRIIFYIFMESSKIMVVLNAPQIIIVDVIQNHRTVSQVT